MTKKILENTPMSDVAYIDRAVGWSKELTRWRARGPGDQENAMREIESDYGINFWTLWQLRYKRDKIKTISISVYYRIKAAHECERANQRRKLGTDLTKTREIAGSDNPTVVEIAAALGEGVVEE